MFGIATLRTRKFPRWAVILLLVGAVLSILPLPSRALIVEVAAAIMGLTLLTGGKVHEEREPRAK